MEVTEVTEVTVEIARNRKAKQSLQYVGKNSVFLFCILAKISRETVAAIDLA